jgi:hypothetical protein
VGALSVRTSDYVRAKGASGALVALPGIEPGFED